MKKIYLLFYFLLSSFLGFSQNVTITKIIETACPDPFVKTVELYVDGTVDFTSEVSFNFMQNGGAWNALDVSGLGTVSNAFVYIVRDIALMQTEFPSTTFTENVNTVVVGSSTNGDDGYQIVLNGKIVSQFGKTATDADNDTESNWNHSDAVATRKDGIADLGVWDATHWEITAENDLDEHTNCFDSNLNLESYFTTLGSTFSLGSGSGWTPTAATCTVAFSGASTTCITKTDGSANDTYTATINFSGGDTGTTFTINSTDGTVETNTLGSEATGTITISGITEGVNITLSASDLNGGGVCDLSVIIDSPSCIPLVINEINADPASDITGDANGDGTRSALDDEFIELYNNSSSSLDLSGYTMSDNSELRHTFPTGSIIPANGFLVLFGGGTPTGDFAGAIVQTASEGEINLSNAGDKITIKNASGEIAEALDYSAYDTGANQSITRSPDVTGDFILHTSVNASLLYSPGVFADETLSTNDLSFEELSIYPNPVNTGYLNIESKINGEKSIELFDIMGRKVLETKINNDILDVSSIKSGVYLLKVSINNQSAYMKIKIE